MALRERDGDIESGRAVVAPTSSRSDSQWTPWLVPTFVVANILIFIVTMCVNHCQPTLEGPRVASFLHRFSFQPLEENPSIGPSSMTLTKMGALRLDDVNHRGIPTTTKPTVNHHQGWRLVTCIWLHAGIIHLVENMWSLVFIGIRFEQQFGFVRIGIIYLLSGFGGSVLSSLFFRDNISVGASGALFGLLGAMIAELITNWNIYTKKLLYTALLAIIFINLAVGILPHVDNFAHIGGFLTGFLLGFIFLLRPQLGPLKPKYKAYQCALWTISIILLIVGLLMALVMVFHGDNGYDHCQWCQYLTCIPTSKWKCYGS